MRKLIILLLIVSLTGCISVTKLPGGGKKVCFKPLFQKKNHYHKK